jgi:phosphatidylinositol glycan class U
LFGSHSVAGLLAASLFLFNPFSVASCIAMSLNIFTTLAFLCALYFALDDRLALSSFTCAIGAYLSFHSVIYSVPLGLVVHQCQKNASVCEKFI